MSDEEQPSDELRYVLRRVLDSLARHLAAQRRDGRGDPLRGLAIEEGEVEALLAALANDLARPPRPAPVALHFAEPPSPRRSPLGHAAWVFGLTPGEFDALVLAIAVELDPRFARIVAYLNDHIGRMRPTIGLAAMLSETGAGAIELAHGQAVRGGLLQLDGDGPLSAQAYRVAPDMLARLVGGGDAASSGLRRQTGGGPELDELAIAPAQRRQLGRWAALVQSGRAPPPLVLAGRDGAGRATAVRAAVAAAGLGLVETAWLPERADRAERMAAAARDALWQHAALLVRVGEPPPDREFAELWATLRAWHLPVALAVPPGLVEAASAAAPVEPAVLSLDNPTIEQREGLWRALLAGEAAAGRVAVSEREIGELAARYDFAPGALVRAVRRALAEHELAEVGGPLDIAALARACRAVGTASIGPIAQRLDQPYTRADLVLPPHLLDELDLAAAWMRHRRQVFEHWGFGRRVAPGAGLSVLFAGEPGTGKTMSAQVLARELGLELFRVDLSRVMSKYIGETEKNLAQLFDDARASGAILFFDEADALFGKRTEVKDAHDRYANLEIGYLLQRMEEHPGTTILATNRMRDLDEAFTRRFHFILDFPMPRPPERRRIWEGMLPRDAARDAAIDFEALARDYDVSGGEIRNSVLSAAFIAAEEGAPIGLRHLKRGLRRELQKTGRVLDPRQRRALDGA